MTDVVEIANERRDALTAEIDTLAAEIDTLAAELGKLDDFIRMAEKLVKNDGNDADEEYVSSSLNLFSDTEVLH